jgi:hypothetical protein
MNYKEKLSQISKILFSADMPVEEKQPIAFADYMTKDGSKLSIDKMEVGGQVQLDGGVAPDGEYTLEDGKVLSVQGGVIAEISTESEEAQDAVEMGAKPKDEVKMSAEVSKEIEDLKQANKDLQTQLSNQLEAQKEMFSMLQKFSEQSAAQPVEKVKSWNEMSSLEKFRASKNN